ncbi:sensor histidine kinase [Blastococcus sp. SYSU D00669]
MRRIPVQSAVASPGVWLTPRRRAAVAVLVTWPLAYFWVDFTVTTVKGLVYHLRGTPPWPYCSGGWVSVTNGCASYSPGLAVVELLVALAVAVVVAVALARWVMHPVRVLAESVGRFGPASLALRLPVGGGPGDETGQLGASLNAVLDRLAEGYEAQRRFAATASHELRTPLATQRALIEVSLSGSLTPEQLELLSRQLLATNERNEQLVDGLLTLAETDRGLMTSGPVPLDELVPAAAEQFRAAAVAADVTLSVEAAPVTVVGERPLVERLVANLVGNAVKYNEPGGSLWVRVDDEGVLSVENTGPVVPAEQVNGLFEPFRRLSGERLAHSGGVGLGLTIVRSIAAAHDAVVAAEARPGGGLRVAVRFPRASAGRVARAADPAVPRISVG